MGEVKYLQQVLVDLAEAVEWYESCERDLGRRFEQEFFETAGRALASPEIFPRVKENVRRVLMRHFPYAIHYRPSIGGIEVLLLWCCYRDPKKLATLLKQRA